MAIAGTKNEDKIQKINLVILHQFELTVTQFFNDKMFSKVENESISIYFLLMG